MSVAVPKSEAEVFEQYYSHVKFLVARAGIRKDYVEDYAMTLMIKFVEKGVLQDYDPDRVSTVNGVARTANFKTFLSGFVSSYLRYFAHRDALEAHRSMITSDAKIGESETPFLDYLGMVVEDDTDIIEATELIERVRKNLKSDKMALFFEMVLLQVHEYGKVDVRELSEMFEVTRSSIHNWLKKLRTEFENCK